RSQSLRPADRLVPGLEAQARRASDVDRSRAPADVPRVRPLQPQGGSDEGDHDGQALRGRSDPARGLRLPATVRWMGLHRGVPHRARVPRRATCDHRWWNVRDHERDPDEARAPRLEALTALASVAADLVVCLYAGDRWTRLKSSSFT